MGCQNGLFYVQVLGNKIKPLGFEGIFKKFIILQVEQLIKKTMIAITTTVGRSEEYE